LVGSRTQLVNHVCGAVKSFGGGLPKCPARSFHRRTSEHIPEALLRALWCILEIISFLTERIRDYDRKLEAISKEHYPETDLLRQVEGIGALTALTFALACVDLVLADPPPQRLVGDAQLLGYLRDRLLRGAVEFYGFPLEFRRIVRCWSRHPDLLSGNSSSPL
jgi:hypothetical protein